MIERIPSRTFLRSLDVLVPSTACLSCQWRSFSTSYHRLQDEPKDPKEPLSTEERREAFKAARRETRPLRALYVPGAAEAETSKTRQRWENTPSSWGKSFKGETFTPEPLSRPIGMFYPPEPGENTGEDTRTKEEKKADKLNVEKYVKTQKDLIDQWRRPAFRDWSNLDYAGGKGFFPPARLFRADKSLWFPNLHGETIAKGNNRNKDTTNVLAEKASVVSVFSSQWGDAQAQSFISKKFNPALHEVIADSKGQAQVVQVNIEYNTMKWWLIRLFVGSLRRRVGKENLDKYFMVRAGVSDEIRECIGLLNSRVGYTYLVDPECKIRWAASGEGTDEERDGLVQGIKRMLSEMAKKKEAPAVTGEATEAADQSPRVMGTMAQAA